MFRTLRAMYGSGMFMKHLTGPLDRLKAIFIKGITDRKENKLAAAHASLTKAVKDLSEGSAIPMALPSASLLQKWDGTDFSELTLDQLEDLGRAHFEGVEGEIPKNVVRAVEIFKYASDHGSRTASYSYAICLKDGIGIKKDVTAGFLQLTVLANDNDHNLAHYAVALMLTNGEVPRDEAAAFRHFNKAARLGVLPAIYNIGNFYSAGMGGAEKSDARAYQYYFAGAQGGDPSAMFTVGTWIYQGRSGGERNLKEAFRWQSLAADAGHPGATFNIGTMHMAGEGTPKDPLQAISYFERAMTLGGGLPQAAVNLGNIYRVGVENVDVDLQKARGYFAAFAHRDEVCATLLKEVEKEIAAAKTTSNK